MESHMSLISPAMSLRCSVTPPVTQEEDSRPDPQVLRDGEYKVYLSSYVPCSDERLNSDFRMIEKLYLQGYRWVSDPSVNSSGEQIMSAHSFGRWMGTPEVLAELRTLGYRPATHGDGYNFLYGDVERRLLWEEAPLVALGSRLKKLDTGKEPEYVAYFDPLSRRAPLFTSDLLNGWEHYAETCYVRQLRGVSVDRSWWPETRFLCVRL